MHAFIVASVFDAVIGRSSARDQGDEAHRVPVVEDTGQLGALVVHHQEKGRAVPQWHLEQFKEVVERRAFGEFDETVVVDAGMVAEGRRVDPDAQFGTLTGTLCAEPFR